MVGVSADTPAIQLKFVEKFGLEFPMVPDPDKTIIEAWGVRKVLGVTAERTTFLIGPDLKVAHVWNKVKVDGHAEDVLHTIERMAAEQA